MAEQARAFEAALGAEYEANDETGRFLVAQAALAMARLERCPEVEWETRRVLIDRAERCWEIDRHVEAAVLGDRLPRRPGRVSAQLLKTSQGCDWLIERWTLLAAAIERAGTCEDDHRRMLADLLGLPPDLRDADPRLAPDRPAADLVALARAESDALRRLKAETLDDLDLDDRDRAAAGLSFDDTTEARRLRGYEAACVRRLTWALDALKQRRGGATASAAPTSSLAWPSPAEPGSDRAEPPPQPAPSETASPRGAPLTPPAASAGSRPGSALPRAASTPPSRPTPETTAPTSPSPHPHAPADPSAPKLNRRARRAARALARSRALHAA